jgi:hypothetical protein
MNKRWEDIKVGDRIKCMNETHGMFGDTGIITFKDSDIDLGEYSAISVKWDHSSAKNCCYFGSFDIIDEACNILNGGQEI